jgi:hypothetical protein
MRFGIENEIVRDAEQREISRELDAVIARRRSLRENFHHDDAAPH